jgi:hypothetical protein
MSMTREIPGPLRAAAGLAAVAVDEARRLPSRLAGLPVLAVGAAMQASMRAQQRYAELMGRGDQVLSHLREPDEQPAWARFDEDDRGSNGAGGADAESWAFSDEQIESQLSDLDADPEDTPDDGAEDLYAPSASPDVTAAEPTTPGPTATNRTGADTARVAAVDGRTGGGDLDGELSDTAGGRVVVADFGGGRDSGAAGAGAAMDVIAGKPLRTTKSARSKSTAKSATRAGAGEAGSAKAGRAKAGAGKSGVKADTAKRADGKSGGTKSARSSVRASATATRRTTAASNDGAGAALPLSNYDSLSLPQLRARISKLNAADLGTLLEYERAHAARAPYLTMLENRLTRVSGV